MIGQKIDHIVVFTAPDHTGPWTPIHSVDVPAWVKEPNVMGYLVAGEIVTDPAIDPRWFRAEKMKNRATH